MLTPEQRFYVQACYQRGMGSVLVEDDADGAFQWDEENAERGPIFAGITAHLNNLEDYLWGDGWTADGRS